jgi:hypothetical protein
MIYRLGSFYVYVYIYIYHIISYMYIYIDSLPFQFSSHVNDVDALVAHGVTGVR